MASVSEERRIANRAYQRAWQQKNRVRLNALARAREKKKKEDSLFEEYGIREIPDGHRICTKCRNLKSLDCFYPRKPTKRHPTTHRSWCKECDANGNVHFRTVKQAYHKNWRLKTDFGITLEEYERLCEQQDNKCAICGTAPNQTNMKFRLSVDHDHETGRIRGLLCSGCNIGLGKLGDNVHGLKRALDYLLGVRSNEAETA